MSLKAVIEEVRGLPSEEKIGQLNQEALLTLLEEIELPAEIYDLERSLPEIERSLELLQRNPDGMEVAIEKVEVKVKESRGELKRLQAQLTPRLSEMNTVEVAYKIIYGLKEAAPTHQALVKAIKKALAPPLGPSNDITLASRELIEKIGEGYDIVLGPYVHDIQELAIEINRKGFEDPYNRRKYTNEEKKRIRELASQHGISLPQDPTSDSISTTETPTTPTQPPPVQVQGLPNEPAITILHYFPPSAEATSPETPPPRVTYHTPETDVEHLLQQVACGNQAAMEATLRAHPEFVTETGNVTDPSGRLFQGITAYQYALWAGDWPMWEAIRHVIVEVAPDHESDLNQQLNDWENGDASTASGHGKHFDYAPTLQAYERYLAEWENQNTDLERLDELWVGREGDQGRIVTRGIGTEQRGWPAGLAQWFCMELPFDPRPDFRQQPLVRTLSVDTWRGRKNVFDVDVGRAFAIVKGRGRAQRADRGGEARDGAVQWSDGPGGSGGQNRRRRHKRNESRKTQ